MKFLFKKGASLQGYGLMIGLVAVVALGATTSIGSSITGLFGSTADTMDNVVTGANNAVPDPSPTPTPNATPEFSGSLPSPGTFSQNQAITPFTVSGFSDSDDDALVFTLSDGGSGIAADFAVTETDTNSSTAEGTQVEISGTPTQTGSHTLTITATDPEGASVTTGAISISVTSETASVYYQCAGNANYVVLVQNTDNQSVGSWTDIRDACQHYGYRALGTSSPSALVDRNGMGTSTNSNLVEAVACHNCYWCDGCNAGYHNYQQDSDSTGAVGGTDDCTHVQGTAASGSILAGGIVNSNRSTISCGTIQQNLGPGTSFGDNTSGETADILIQSGSDSNCTRNNTTQGAISYTGTPDYLLCADTTIH